MKRDYFEAMQPHKMALRGSVVFGCSSGVLALMLLLATSQATPIPSLLRGHAPASTPGGTNGLRDLPMTIDAGSQTASLNVPSPFHSVVIQYCPVASGTWVNFKTLSVKATPSDIRISLPGDYAQKLWRATGSKVAAPAIRNKYPSKFFAGKKSFRENVAPSYTQNAPQVANGPVALASAGTVANNAVEGDARAGSLPAATIEESDIWKADGSTVYFFNQLRGLQVIDLSDPANPTLQAYFRLPAKGQDLYIVPGSGSIRYAVLLTQEYDNSSWCGNTGVKLVKVEGSSAMIVDQAVVSGWMADSRMVGNRLYLATQHWTWDNSGINEDATVLNELVVDPVAGTLSTGNSHTIAGSWPVISAGNDWMAVTGGDWSDWQSSKVTLFSLGKDGAAQLTASPVALCGRLYNKYDVQYDGATLSAVSQRWVNDTNSGSNDSWWNGTQVTTLENFNYEGSNLASLEIVRGETLQAVRFDGDKAYVVTSRQNDPLFVIDLSSPTNPVVAGQLEVPGWSTQIVPVGQNKLFTIGYGSDWNVCASLFDVSDPANPALLNRVSMSSNWGWSAATYDDKALKVLPDSGLVLVPYTACNSTNGTTEHFVQFLNLDAAAGTLSLAGKIDHNFDPLRADLVGSCLASISQRELVTASITDHSAPVLLADLLLAWPVNRVLSTTNHLIQIEEGASSCWWGWSGSAVATARISPVSDPDSVLAEIPLGGGIVKDAVLRGTSLYVLRQDPADVSYWGWYSSDVQSHPSPTLTLDIYDASQLPDLNLSGRASLQLPGNDSAWDLSSLLFPSDKSAVVVAQPQVRAFRWRGWMPVTDPTPAVMRSGARAAACCVYPGYNYLAQSTNPPFAVIFQTENSSAPIAQPPLPLTDTNATPVVSSAAGGGLLVFGYASKETPLANGSGELSASQHNLRVLDLNDLTTPILGPAITLPGRLLGVTDITSDGFLAWSETKTRTNSRQIQVSACNAVTLSLITGSDLGTNSGCITTAGRNLFSVQGHDVVCYSLSDAGVLAGTGRATFDWVPSSLRLTTTPSVTLLGSDWQHLFSWSYADPKAEVLDWATDRSVDLQKSANLTDRSVLSPAGQYGVDEYHP
jgi:hypothetical protein